MHDLVFVGDSNQGYLGRPTKVIEHLTVLLAVGDAAFEDREHNRGGDVLSTSIHLGGRILSPVDLIPSGIANPTGAGT